jgi:hypothetical protein
MGTLPPGTLGFDCNVPVSRAVAQKFYAHGERFAVRYIPRVAHAPNDVTAHELVDLLLGKLGVMLVQHVAHPGWKATALLGSNYGKVAVRESRKVGYPAGCTLWCDLEEVSAPEIDVIAYLREWSKPVRDAGYEDGLYVGYNPGLSRDQLYHDVPFTRYWGSYNGQRWVPSVRGLCMQQSEYPQPEHRVAGVPFQYDTNTILVDAKGGTPTLLLP